MRWLIPAVCVLAAVALPTPATAAPVVSVKARTAIEIDPIRRDHDGIVVRGRVVDKFSRAPIDWVDVEVHLDHLVRRAITDADGHFEARFQVTTGRHDLVIEFEGDMSRDPSRYEVADFDVTKNPLELELLVSRSVASYGEDDLTATVTASSDFGEVSLPIALHLGDDSADPGDLPRVATIETGADGTGEVTLAPAQLGEPGRKRVIARFDGDDAYDAAQARASFSVRSDSAITFDVGSTDLEYEGTLRARGRVTDAVGDGIGGGAVSLLVGSRHIGETATAGDGTYDFDVSASELGAGRFNVQAVFEPSKEFHRASRSQPRTIQVAEPEPVPVSYTIAAFAFTGLALLAFVAMRTRPWESWLSRWRARRADEEEDEGEEDDSGEVHHGLSLARPSLVSTLRRTKDHAFSGVVRNAVTHRPVGNARLRLTDEEGREEETHTDGAGRFVFEQLGTGRWKVEVAGHGYVTEWFTITSPHRGELRGARVDLLPVRERIFALYGAATRPLLPDPSLWGIWTPRQIFDHVREGQPPASAMRDLTDFVEESYFSQRTPGEELIAEARDRIDRARAELGALRGES